MTEKDLQIKISDYIEDNMSDKDKIDFETFLLDNNELKLEVENLKVMLSDIKGIKSLRLDDSFDQRLRRSIDNYDNKKADSLNIFNLFNNPTYASIGAIAAMFLVIVTTFVLRPSNLNSNQMIIDSSTNSYIEEEFVEGDSIDYEEVEGEAQDREQESKNHNKILRVDDSTDN